MKRWTVHLDRLNPVRNPIVVEGWEDRTYYRDRRTCRVTAVDEAAAVSAAHKGQDRKRYLRERSS